MFLLTIKEIHFLICSSLFNDTNTKQERML